MVWPDRWVGLAFSSEASQARDDRICDPPGKGPVGGCRAMRAEPAQAEGLLPSQPAEPGPRMRNRDKQSGAPRRGRGRKSSQPARGPSLSAGLCCNSTARPKSMRAQAALSTSPCQGLCPTYCQSQLLLSAGGCGPLSGCQITN